jgi:hypothetical protein
MLGEAMETLLGDKPFRFLVDPYENVENPELHYDKCTKWADIDPHIAWGDDKGQHSVCAFYPEHARFEEVDSVVCVRLAGQSEIHRFGLQVKKTRPKEQNLSDDPKLFTRRFVLMGDENSKEYAKQWEFIPFRMLYKWFGSTGNLHMPSKWENY